MSGRTDDVGLEPTVPSTPSRKRKRNASSPSSSSTFAATEFISNCSEVSNVPGQLARSATNFHTENQSPTKDQSRTQSPTRFHDTPVDKAVAPDTHGSLSPRAAATRQLSYLSIDESVVDSASEASDPTTIKTPSHSSPPGPARLQRFNSGNMAHRDPKTPRLQPSGFYHHALSNLLGRGSGHRRILLPSRLVLRKAMPLRCRMTSHLIYDPLRGRTPR